MKKTAIFYFAVMAFLTSSSSWNLLFSHQQATIGFSMVTMLWLPRSESRPVPRVELYLTLGLLVAVIVALEICRFASSSVISSYLSRLIYHPAFVVALWAIMIGSIYRRLQRERKSDA